MDELVEPRLRKRQWLAPDFVRAMLAGHSALGLAFAALIYVVCLSGTLAVFLHEFQRWEQPGAPILERAPAPEAVAAAVRAGYAQGLADNAAHDMFLFGPTPMSPRFLVNYHDHEKGVDGNWLANAEGELITRLKAPWAEFLAALHMHLHLPRTWGMFLVGMTGVALLSSLISGLLAHPRIFKDAFALRWGGSKRLQDADLHNRLGVWGLPFHVAVSLTGALLGLSTLIVGVLAYAAYDGDSGKAFATLLGPRASADEAPAAVPDIAAMIRHVQGTHPEATFVSLHIDHVGKAGQVVHLGMRTPGHIAFSNSYYFDGNANALGHGGLETGSIGQQILGTLQPLHFGWFGGLTVKVLYGLLGLALTVVTSTGVSIWLARRRDKGRPAPGWERIWAAVVWGQPLALAAAALCALLLEKSFILPVYLAVTLLALCLCAAIGSGVVIGRVLRLLTAAGLVGVVAAHGLIWGATVGDPAAWGVNLAIVACALVLAGSVFWGRRVLDALA
jgi:uncharacterized iron-regulated membrane protein